MQCDVMWRTHDTHLPPLFSLQVVQGGTHLPSLIMLQVDQDGSKEIEFKEFVYAIQLNKALSEKASSEQDTLDAFVALGGNVRGDKKDRGGRGGGGTGGT